MNRRNYRIFSFLIIMALILACAPTLPTLAPVSTPLPVFDPNSVNTAIVLTSEAAATQTALMIPPSLTPTVTSLPTSTLPPSETPSPTFVFILPTSTVPSPTPIASLTPEGTPTSQFACRVDSQSPADNSTFAPGTDFDAGWQVTNTGSSRWEATSADYRYISGDKIHKNKAYDFTKSVGAGKSTTIIVDMKAPNSPGTYSTTWMISVGKNRFCAMNLTIVVK
jgi:hypothetical protein